MRPLDIYTIFKMLDHMITEAIQIIKSEKFDLFGPKQNVVLPSTHYKKCTHVVYLLQFYVCYFLFRLIQSVTKT
jgi:hypothetical protein